MLTCLRHVEETLVPVSRPDVGGSLSVHNANDGRFPHMLGSSHEWLLCPGSAGRPPSHVAQELPGDAGRVSRTGTLPSRPEVGSRENSFHSEQLLAWAPESGRILSRQGLRPGEWRPHSEVVELLWRVFSLVEVDLFTSQETTHCPLWLSLTHPAPLHFLVRIATARPSQLPSWYSS